MKRSTFTRSLLALGLIVPVVTFAATNTTTSSTTHAKEAKMSTHTSQTAKPAHTKIDLNSATRSQLMTLPGVNEATADKIIAARPFESPDQVLKRNIVTKDEYSKIHARITAKPMAPEAAKK